MCHALFDFSPKRMLSPQDTCRPIHLHLSALYAYLNGPLPKVGFEAGVADPAEAFVAIGVTQGKLVGLCSMDDRKHDPHYNLL
jgi:hypothetical protein